MIATEAIMKELAKKFGENEEKWALTGLLHDLDLEKINNDMHKHALQTIEILKPYNLDQEITHAILSHNEEGINVKRESKFDFALTCAETITGMVVATVLVLPDKKIATVTAENIKNRMKEKGFARNVKRERIMDCEKIGLSLDEFVSISLDAMKSVAGELGL